MYPLTKIDKEYHDTITFEKKQNKMLELAESYWELPDEDDGPDWLGGVETEAEFWEHS